MAEKFEPEIVAFCCWQCGYGAADLAGDSRMQYPANVKIVRVPCSGRVDPLLVLHAFRCDADGVMVIGCLRENCHHVTGSDRMRQQIGKLKKALDAIGLDGNRVDTCFVSAAMAYEFAEAVSGFTEKVRKIGPNPLRRSTSSK